MKSILIIHGPNLDLLGTRQPEVYGRLTLDQINKAIFAEASRLGVDVTIHQGNSEESLVMAVREHSRMSHGIVINPGILSHYSVSMAEVLLQTGLPVIEVHLSNIHSREMFRRQSVITPLCIGQICGLGPDGYLAALRFLVAADR